MISENLPLANYTDVIVINNLINFKLYRGGSASNNIVLSSDLGIPTYAFLPKVITQGATPTSYVFFTKNTNMELNNITDIKFNKAGLYKYFLDMSVFSNFGGIFAVDFVDGSNNSYATDILTTTNINNATTSVILNGFINHNLNDIVKLRFGCIKNGGGAMNFEISKLTLTIESS